MTGAPTYYVVGSSYFRPSHGVYVDILFHVTKCGICGARCADCSPIAGGGFPLNCSICRACLGLFLADSRNALLGWTLEMHDKVWASSYNEYGEGIYDDEIARIIVEDLRSKRSAQSEAKLAPADDYVCARCANPKCSSTEKSCWKCGEPIVNAVAAAVQWRAGK